MTRWYQEKKHEHYYREAKAQGYRARSAFKLKQIQERFSIFSPGDTVVDLGAVPGGWSQVTLEYIGGNGRVIAIDLSMMTPLAGVASSKETSAPKPLSMNSQTAPRSQLSTSSSQTCPRTSPGTTLWTKHAACGCANKRSTSLTKS